MSPCTRNEIRAITSRMTPPSGGPVRPLSNYELSIGVAWTILEVVAARWQLLPDDHRDFFFLLPPSEFLLPSVHRCSNAQLYSEEKRNGSCSCRERSSKDNRLFLRSAVKRRSYVTDRFFFRCFSLRPIWRYHDTTATNSTNSKSVRTLNDDEDEDDDDENVAYTPRTT